MIAKEEKITLPKSTILIYLFGEVPLFGEAPDESR